MSTEDKSPSTPTSSDESPKNTIRVIKTSDSEQTLVEVKVAGESGTKVTVFGGDGPRTENKTNEHVNGADEKQLNISDKPDNESNAKQDKSPESEAKNIKNVIGVNGVEETVGKNPEKKTKDNDDDKEITRLQPLTTDEIDKIVSKYEKKKDVAKYLEFFWSVDEFGFGFFTHKQLIYRLWKMGRRLTEQEVAGIFVDLDHDNDRLVSLDEFLDEMTREKPMPKTDEELRVLFERCDKNKDGFVCQDDIEQLLTEANVPFLETEVFVFLDRYCTEGDRRLDLKTFQRVLRRREF